MLFQITKTRVIVLIIIILLIFFYLKPEILFPFLKINFWKLSIDKVFEFYFGQKRLTEENKALKDQLNKFVFENLKLRLDQNEYHLISYYIQEKRPDKFILSRLIGQRNETGKKWFILDRGKEDGLEEGLAVVDENHFLLGKITEVGPKMSFFTPLLEDQIQFSAEIISALVAEQKLFTGQATISKDFIGGIVESKYGTTLVIDLIPKESKIFLGDFVITSGLEEKIKRGLIIGQISKIEKNFHLLFQKADILPLGQPEKKKIVKIILHE